MLSALPYWLVDGLGYSRPTALSMLNTLRAFLLRSRVKAERRASGRGFQPVAEVLLHPLDRRLGIALRQRLHHGSMLTQRILDPARFEKRLMPVQFHDLA